MTTTDSLLTRFVRWLNFKVLLHKAKERLFVYTFSGCTDVQRLRQIFASSLKHVKLRSQPSLGRKQTKTLLWRSL